MKNITKKLLLVFLLCCVFCLNIFALNDFNRVFSTVSTPSSQQKEELRVILNDFAKKSEKVAGKIDVKLDDYFYKLLAQSGEFGENDFKIDFLFDFAKINKKIVMSLKSDVNLYGFGFYFGLEPILVDIENLEVYSSYKIKNGNFVGRNRLNDERFSVLNSYLDTIKNNSAFVDSINQDGFDGDNIVDYISKVGKNKYAVIFEPRYDLLFNPENFDSSKGFFIYHSINEEDDASGAIYMLATFEIENNNISSIKYDVYYNIEDFYSEKKEYKLIMSIKEKYTAFSDQIFLKNSKGKYLYIPR